MKVGVVLEGGASRTIFSCGVTDAWLEEGFMPDYFIGVSAGIAYGVSYLSGQKGRNWEIAEKYMWDKRYMGMHHLRKSKNFYNVGLVFRDIPNHLLPFDYEAFEKFPGEVEAAVTDIRTGKAQYLPVPRNKNMMPILIASCALPVLFQPVTIRHRQYLDGGIADSIPYQHAFEKGCDKVIVVLTRPRDYEKKTEKALYFSNFIYQKYPKMVESMTTRPQRYNQCTSELERLEKEGKVFVIAPEDTYGIGRTEGKPEILKPLYEEGYYMMKERMVKLRKYLEQPL